MFSKIIGIFMKVCPKIYFFSIFSVRPECSSKMNVSRDKDHIENNFDLPFDTTVHPECRSLERYIEGSGRTGRENLIPFNTTVHPEYRLSERCIEGSGRTGTRKFMFLFPCLLFMVSGMVTAQMSPVQNMYTKTSLPSADMADEYTDNTLVKRAIIFSDAARMQIIKALDVINQDIAYWQYQKDHPVSYFLHKSPTKWVVGCKQSDEIHSNIAFLQELQEQLYKMLGEMAIHVASYNQNSNIKEQCEWIETLLDTVSFINEDGIMTSNQIEKTATRLHNSLSVVARLKEKIVNHSAHARKPYYITANWMFYTAVAAGAGYAGYHCYNNGTVIKQSISDALQKLSEKYDEFKSRKPFFDQQVTQNDYDAVKKEIDTYTRAAYKANSMTREQATEILIDLKVDGHKGLYKYLRSLSPTRMAGVYNTQTRSEVVELLAGHTKYRFMYLLACLENGVYNVGGKVAALVPVLGALWGMKKLYEWNTYHDYSPIRIALTHVNSVFIESDCNELSEHDYGKLIYLIAQLKDKVTSHLSSGHDEYREVMADIEKLESNRFTLQARQAMIDNMYKRYVFLSVV